MLRRVLAVSAIFLLIFTIACATRPEYPSRNIDKKVIVNEGVKYTILAENTYGNESTLLIYEAPGFFWAEEDCSCRLDIKEKIAILKALQRYGVNVIGARVENGPSEGNSYKMFVYTTQNTASENNNDNNKGNVTIIGGGFIADLEGANNKDIESVENSEDTKKEAE